MRSFPDSEQDSGNSLDPNHSTSLVSVTMKPTSPLFRSAGCVSIVVVADVRQGSVVVWGDCVEVE